MNPELAGYCYSSVDYRYLEHADQTRLCVIRLEAERLRLISEAMKLHEGEQPIQYNDLGEEKVMICSVCYTTISLQNQCVYSDCGHVFCRVCHDSFLQTPRRACPTCRSFIDDARNQYRALFRFNFREKPVCRNCCTEFDERSVVYGLRCGDVFCERCVSTIRTRCIACATDFDSCRPVRLFITFT